MKNRFVNYPVQHAATVLLDDRSHSLVSHAPAAVLLE